MLRSLVLKRPRVIERASTIVSRCCTEDKRPGQLLEVWCHLLVAEVVVVVVLGQASSFVSAGSVMVANISGRGLGTEPLNVSRVEVVK